MTYSNGDDQVYSDSNQANSLRIGFELLKQFENWENYDKAMEAYRYIDEIIEEGKKNVLADAKAWAEKYKDELYFTCWHLAQTMELHIPCAAVISWRCSGSMLCACTRVSTSMVHLKQRIRSFR